MNTKADLLTAWCKWTGDRVPEARHRICALSEADLLPSRAHPLTYEDLARALLGSWPPRSTRTRPRPSVNSPRLDVVRLSDDVVTAPRYVGPGQCCPG